MLRTVMIDGRPGDTARYVSSDTATGLPDSVLTNAGAECVGLLISVETYPVRVAFGVDPTTTLGHLLPVGSNYRVYGNNLASELKYINASPGANGVLQITPFYT